MSDVEYLGNCANLINFDNLIKNLGVADSIGPTASIDDDNISEIARLWNSTGYDTSVKTGTVRWNMYYPDSSFDKSILSKILDFTKISHYSSAWISQINPGYCAAPHYDRYPVDITPYRLHIHLEDSHMGHIFYVGNTYLTDYKQGDIFKWKNPNAWHAGTNIGLKPKFMFNLY